MIFVIRPPGHIERVSEKELSKRLCDNYYGKDAVFIREGDIEGSVHLNEWKENWVLIIGGRPLNPIPVTQTITSYSFPEF